MIFSAFLEHIFTDVYGSHIKAGVFGSDQRDPRSHDPGTNHAEFLSESGHKSCAR